MFLDVGVVLQMKLSVRKQICIPLENDGYL